MDNCQLVEAAAGAGVLDPDELEVVVDPVAGLSAAAGFSEVVDVLDDDVEELFWDSRLSVR